MALVELVSPSHIGESLVRYVKTTMTLVYRRGYDKIIVVIVVTHCTRVEVTSPTKVRNRGDDIFNRTKWMEGVHGEGGDRSKKSWG